MGRTKGSKNRQTLIEEMRARGDRREFDGWEYDKLKTEHERVLTVAPEPPPPPEPVERTVVEPDFAKSVVETARAEFVRMVEYFAPGGLDSKGEPVVVPERIQDFLRKAFYAPDLPAAKVIAKKAVDKLYLHLSCLAGRRKIPGPNTERNIEKRIKEAESWARRYEKWGDHEGAQRYRNKAEVLRSTPIVTTKVWGI